MNNSPGIGPGQGVSDQWHRFFVFIATFVMSVKQLLHFSILLQHFVRLFSNFYNFCYSCCSLFGQLLFIVQKVRARGGLSGSPWADTSLPVSPFGGTFFTHNFVHYHLLQKIRSSSKHVPKMVPKSIQNEASNRYTFLLCFFVVSRGAQKSEHVFGPCLCSPNHFGHRSHGTRNGWTNRQKRYTNTPRKHD